jgi:hypothetical protein
MRRQTGWRCYGWEPELGANYRVEAKFSGEQGARRTKQDLNCWLGYTPPWFQRLALFVVGFLPPERADTRVRADTLAGAGRSSFRSSERRNSLTISLLVRRVCAA